MIATSVLSVLVMLGLLVLGLGFCAIAAVLRSSELTEFEERERAAMLDAEIASLHASAVRAVPIHASDPIESYPAVATEPAVSAWPNRESTTPAVSVWFHREGRFAVPLNPLGASEADVSNRS